MSNILNFYQSPHTADFVEPLEFHQTPYDNPKFFHAMRLRLLTEYDLPTSSIAVLVGLHMICDPNTGLFMRDDMCVRKQIGLKKSTYSIGFAELLATGLVSQVDDLYYVITHYESDRCDGTRDKQNYFRITHNFLGILPRLVHHGHKTLMLFALECLDRSRHYNAENVISMNKIVRHRKLGSCRKRALEALQLLKGFMDFALIPNSSQTDDLVQFWPIKIEQRDEDQERLRTLHGEVTAEIQKSYSFANGNGKISWRELSRMTRKLIEYGLTHHLVNHEKRLDDRVIKRMAGLFGAYCARNHVVKRLAYLGYILKNGDLEQSYRRMSA